MRTLQRLAGCLTWAIVSITGAAGQPLPSLPAPADWLAHLHEEILPFWNHPDAFGRPVGDFPAIRCDDGSAVVWTRPCREVQRNSWLMQRPRNVVAQSRQAYTYGVAFHLTGNPAHLELMKAGVDYLRANVVDRVNGGMATNQDARGVWGPKSTWRNPQELAYGLLGMGFYYYLTRDAAVLADIAAVKRHIFANYYDYEQNIMYWLGEDNGADAAWHRRLVAQLDQMNAYMVLLAPVLPEPMAAEWKADLVRLSRLMIEKFYSPAENLFFLNANFPADRDLARSGTDFGHTIKAMWMIRFTGLLAGEPALVEFAETNGRRVLERAFLADSGSWASGVNAGGALDRSKSWWIYAELDQFTATLGLADRALAERYLPRTVDYYRRYLVDHASGEVWSTVDGTTNQPTGDLPKQWPWKNGYHSIEHALVGYITSAATRGEPVTLYYAFPSFNAVRETVRPYFYTGRVESAEDNGGWQKVTFAGVESK